MKRARWCRSNERWSRKVIGSFGDEYTVSYGQRGAQGYGYACSCAGFRYRKRCRHIQEVKNQRCGFGWSAVGGRPVRMGERCPVCGDATSVAPLSAGAPQQAETIRRKALPMILIKPSNSSLETGG